MYYHTVIDCCFFLGEIYIYIYIYIIETDWKNRNISLFIVLVFSISFDHMLIQG